MNKYTENFLWLNLAWRKDPKFGSNTHSAEFNLNSAFPANLNKLHPAYVTGFCDGEACFHLAIGVNSRYKLGYYVNPGFTMALHKKDEKFLLLLKEFFGGVGVVKSSSRPNIVEYRILAIKDLDVILNHFDLYPLITKKEITYCSRKPWNVSKINNI